MRSRSSRSPWCTVPNARSARVRSKPGTCPTRSPTAATTRSRVACRSARSRKPARSAWARCSPGCSHSWYRTRPILTLPIAVALGCEVAHLVLVWLLVPPHVATHHDAERARARRTVVRQGVRLAATHHDLRRLLLATAAIGCGLSSIELLWQPRVTSLPSHRPTSNSWIFGRLRCRGVLLRRGGRTRSRRAPTARARPARAAAIGTFGYGLCLTGLAAAGGVVPFGIAYTASYLFQSASGPYHRTLLHARNTERSRARRCCRSTRSRSWRAVSSSNAVLSRVADTTSIPFAWGVAAAVVIASRALLPRPRAARARSMPSAPEHNAVM